MLHLHSILASYTHALLTRMPTKQDDSSRFSNHLNAYFKLAIVQLVLAAQDSTGSIMLWKPRNLQLLTRMRHDSPTVRFAAL